MAQYLITAPHTDPECIRALNTIEEWGMHLLHHTWFGCVVGVHTSWLQLEADTEPEALAVLPPPMRSHAQAVEVRKLTPDQIKALHQ